MAQIIVDPEQLRVFARRLLDEVRVLRERQATLEGQRDTLEGVWRDKRYEEFEKAYLPAIQRLDRFCRQSEDYAAYLRKKADAADRYLRR